MMPHERGRGNRYRLRSVLNWISATRGDVVPGVARGDQTEVCDESVVEGGFTDCDQVRPRPCDAGDRAQRSSRGVTRARKGTAVTVYNFVHWVRTIQHKSGST